MASLKYIPASFWRGGTSRGLIFESRILKHYSGDVVDEIVHQAMGSPDPSGRQISGLGGGASSLSKVCIIGAPGQGSSSMPGVPWAEAGVTPSGDAYDIVYRFGQVGIRSRGIDWQATCGNMLSAVAQYAVQERVVPEDILKRRALDYEANVKRIPLSILEASSGALLKAYVLTDEHLLPYNAQEREKVYIAGVPEGGTPIKLEFPLGQSSGNHIAAVSVGEYDLPVTIASTGLPNIFVFAQSLRPFLGDMADEILKKPSSELDSKPEVLECIERIRREAAYQNGLKVTLSSPKVTLVGSSQDFISSSGEHISKDTHDIIARAISSGQFHASIPGTTLGAINVAVGFGKTLPGTLTKHISSVQTPDRCVHVRVAHAAGVSESTVEFHEGVPSQAIMIRTAREIMRGSVCVYL